MAKGSVRKKGKKWYYRFYVEDASGNLVQKECAGTESKSETEKLLRQAMEDYESKKFIAKADNITLGELLDIWAEEELKVGTLSNGTVENYLGAIRCIKKHPIADRKLKTVTAGHLQAFLDLLTFGGTYPDGTVKRGIVVFQIKRAANLQIILAPYKIDVVLQPHYPETLLHITRTKILPCKLIAQEYSVSSYENGSSSSSIWQA